MSDVDFIIVDLDGGEMLLDCLRSLLQQSVRPARVILVDNGSAQPTIERVAGVPLPFVHLRLEKNAGFAGGVNAALHRVTSGLFALVNNDVVLDRVWTERLLIEMERNVRTAAVQSWLALTPGVLDGAGIGIDAGRFVQRGHLQSAASAGSWPPFWGVSATAALYRSDAVGGSMFDDRFFAYYEDVELSARLRAAGWNLAVVDEVLAVHRGSATRSRLGSRAAYLQTRNRHWVARRHRGTGSSTSLLVEDAREIGGALRRGSFAESLARVRGLLAGRFAPI